MNDLTVRERLPSAERLKRRAAELSSKSKSETTKRVYKIAWSDFEYWCNDNSVAALPALPETVAAYLTHMSEALAVSTINQHLAAIAYYHTLAQQPDPTHDNRVRELLKGIRRELGTASQGKDAVMLEQLLGMVSAQPDDLRGLRNRAILLLDFSGAFRRSEITARFIQDESLNVSDLTFEAAGLIVTLRRSKTDQEGKGKTKFIPHLKNQQACAVCVLQTWLKEAEITEGPVFRPVDRWGHVGVRPLTAQWVSRIVKDSAGIVGLERQNVAAHSLRSGFVTQAFADGVPIEDIKSVTLHELTDTVLRYNRSKEPGQIRTIRRVFGESERNAK